MLPDPRAPVEVFRARTRKEVLERALVLQARGIPHRILQRRGGSFLVVAAADAEAAYEELSDYGEENVNWPPPRVEPPLRSKGVVGAALYALTIIALHPIGQQGLLGWNWWESGKLVAGRVTAGELERVFTALTLHGGIGHLIGNVIFGCTFAVLASHTMGAGLTWLCTVLAGALGNLLNAWVQDPSHSAIGASTAVFGCLGLLMTYEWIRRQDLDLPRMRRVAPLMAGVALLGYLGTGGGDATSAVASRTDVVAHLTGLVSGAALGIVVGLTRAPERLGSRAQRAAGILAAALVASSWVVALS